MMPQSGDRMNKHMIPLFLMIASCWLAPAHAADDTIAADQQFSSISRLLERADNALENGALQDAGRLYGASVRAYEQFMQSFPTFAPDLVRFRIAYCRNQMAMIRQRMARTQTESPTTAAPQPAQRVAVTRQQLQSLAEGDPTAIETTYRTMEQAGNPAAPLFLAALHVKQDQLDEARKVLEQHLADFPHEPAAHYNMAQLILRDSQPDLEKARQHYRRAIEGGAPRDQDLEIVINF